MRMKETISMKLFKTLQKGKEQLGKEALDRVIGFIESQRTGEDSFINKSGKEDIYYTVFGWMLSYVLGIRLDNKKTGEYLEKQRIEKMDLIHYAAYMRCGMIRQMQKTGKPGLLLHSLLSVKIRNLQGFDGIPHGDITSPYTQFIWLSLQEDTGQKIKDSKVIKDLLYDYHLKDGGYSNRKNGINATTNATVAALAVLGQLDGYSGNSDIYYLQELQENSGGFSAAKNSPLPDLLSTATSLFTLSCYGVQPNYIPREFIEAHWLESGGFSATILEDISDVEYTFYGLLALGTLN